MELINKTPDGIEVSELKDCYKTVEEDIKVRLLFLSHIMYYSFILYIHFIIPFLYKICLILFLPLPLYIYRNIMFTFC